ncbi:hypothetical protein [Candidatus Uabimicrobium amorphum]|uniref:Uncharacterized protein n=1 Tax=Uabimicrobium amorphum TaxID=2596890 RepID=A0A5S9IT31_UABAM|nr:hypothetical protein [Candidatus Uabimicrobium amorphum]BBM86630.1 hypothetical protein UABAM_05016 [Candidatus Uabimicrobium amorphum]
MTQSQVQLEKAFFFVFLCVVFQYLYFTILRIYFQIDISHIGLYCLTAFSATTVLLLLNKLDLQPKTKQIYLKISKVLYSLGGCGFVMGIISLSIPMDGMGPLLFFMLIMISYIPLGIAIVCSYLAQKNGLLFVNILILISPLFVYYLGTL